VGLVFCEKSRPMRSWVGGFVYGLWVLCELVWQCLCLCVWNLVHVEASRVWAYDHSSGHMFCMYVDEIL
jgi:hypothetical protein